MRRMALLFAVVCIALTACAQEAPAPPTPILEDPTAWATATPVEEPTPLPSPTPEPTAVPWRPAFSGEACEPSETRSCAVLFVLPDQFYASHTLSLPPQFERAGYAVMMGSNVSETVSICNSALNPYNQQPIEVEVQLADVQVTDYDAIVYAGGYGCRSQWNEAQALRIAREAVEQGVVVGAIGCGPTILAHAGVLVGREASICALDVPVKQGDDYCELLESLGAICSDAQIVRDGLIVTAWQASRYFVPGIIEVVNEQDAQ
ncbi:MAG: DJ-1/PfpI family protein [Anaerolineae bacterium]|nr:DJ-1/PfpI family protein [Anaerolineae bacterium]